MAEQTEIAWCDSTFNPWIGCQKVSAGCDNCYAETLMDKRYHKVEWGPHGERKRTSASYWRQPLTWNKHFASFQAKHGRRQRVFCASLADVFDNQAPVGARADLWNLIASTPNLDWLLLTKRPENVAGMVPDTWWAGAFPHVWLGTTCEDQAAYDRRWPLLNLVANEVCFISYEPALSALDVSGHDSLPSWIIAGGESGRGHRAEDVAWYRSLRDQCEALEIPFFMKQMAGKRPIPSDLMIREFPGAAS